MSHTKSPDERSRLLSVKVPETLERDLEQRAEKLGQSKSEVVREAVQEYLARRKGTNKGSFLDQARDLAGVVEAEPDLSTNPEHLEGYGR
jgi:metal-responsive CopG/Arc/MetJ family transcriptional regulator